MGALHCGSDLSGLTCYLATCPGGNLSGSQKAGRRRSWWSQRSPAQQVSLVAAIIAASGSLLAALLTGVFSALTAHSQSPPASSRSSSAPSNAGSPTVGSSRVPYGPYVAVLREAGFSGGCGSWIVTKPFNDLTPPSGGGATPQWVEQSRAIDATNFGPYRKGQHTDGASNIDVTIQGRIATPVILTGIHFVPVRRTTQKIHGGAVTVACGGPMEASGIKVNLDQDPIRIVSSFREMVPKLPADQPQWLLTPLRFPYKVTNTDGEVFKIIAYAHSYIAWYAIIYWSVDGRNGQTIINNQGKPFQTAPADQASASYSYKNNRWYTCPPKSLTCFIS